MCVCVQVKKKLQWTQKPAAVRVWLMITIDIVNTVLRWNCDLNLKVEQNQVNCI